ncbi:hypothetical protein C5N14_07750 [Micromonospora sp. MW-13]|nr:hypothetical protein C5N14_07750 [Micromonospora sp. MW-13]
MSHDGVREHADDPVSTSATPSPRPARANAEASQGAAESFFSTHLALSLSAIPVLLVFLRVGRVAGFEPTTLIMLIETVDVFRLALTTLIQWGPPLILMAIGLSFVSMSRLEAPQASDNVRINTAVRHLFATGLLLCILTTSPTMLAAVAAFVLINALTERIWKFIDRRRRRPPIYADLGAIYFTLAALLLLAPNSMWLPAENIHTAGSSAVTGYVLKENDDRTTVLVDSDRRIIVIPSDSITTREPCRLDPTTKPLAAYIGGATASVPQCPKSR